MFLAIFIIVVILFFSLFDARFKGKIGEKAVANKLRNLPLTDYKILNDIMIRSNSTTTQIDHIVVSKYGIFVIETKNYKGIITGSQFSEKWTKNMYGKKYEFRNPLMQNFAHTKALENILNLSSDMFIPIVVFLSESSIKVNVKSHVINIKDLLYIINEYKTVKLTNDMMESIINTLQNENIIEDKERKKHVDNIKINVKNNNSKVNKNICPKCNGKLIIRKGKYGQFLGCSNYPKCRFTGKI